MSLRKTKCKSRVSNSAIADKPPDACARRCSLLRCQELLSGELAGFFDFYLPLFHLPSIRSIFGMEKLEWLGYNLAKVAG